jgi:hypothetical protein
LGAAVLAYTVHGDRIGANCHADKDAERDQATQFVQPFSYLTTRITTASRGTMQLR